MRLLYLTDLHGKTKNPVNRKDNFPLAFLRKLMEVANTCPIAKINAVLVGGDMWDLPRVSPDLCGSAIEIIKSSGVPWYITPGSHDTYGYNYDSLNYTMLGVMAKAGVVTILNRENPIVLSGDGFDISLQGQEHTRNIDKGNNEDYCVIRDISCKWHILVAHGMVVDKPFHPDVPHTLVSNIDSNADLVLLGHYHPGFDPIKVNQTTFINPGSALRTEAGQGDNRIPQFAIIDVTYEHLKYKLFPFRTAQKPEEILDFTGKQQQKYQQAVLAQFKQKVIQNNAFSQAIDVPTALQMVAKDPANNIDQSLLTEAKNRLAQTQQSKDDSVPILENFVESPVRVFIDRIEAENFMSYDKLDIELNHGLNIIRGESNNGKTNILRLIRWVENNEPRGDSMVSTWANSCWGRITYSNGYILERGRTKTSSGYYEVTDPQGNVQKYTGFGTDIPPEVYNAHQRPPVWLTKDDKRDLTFASQLEPAFLVTESAGARAAAIGRLTNVQNVDATIRKLNAENKEFTKEIKIKSTMIDTEAKKLLAFADLPDELNRINEFQILIDNAKIQENVINKLQSIKASISQTELSLLSVEERIAIYSNLPSEEEITNAEALGQRIRTLKSIQQTIAYVEDSVSEIEEKKAANKMILSLEDDLNKAEQLVTRLQMLSSIRDRIRSSDLQITAVNKKLESIKEILTCEPLLKDAENSLRQLEKLNTIKANITQANTGLTLTEQKIKSNGLLLGISSFLKEADIYMSKLTALLSLKNRFDNIEDQFISLEFQTQASETKAKRIESEIDTLLGEDCQCPTCGQIISKQVLIGGNINE